MLAFRQGVVAFKGSTVSPSCGTAMLKPTTGASQIEAADEQLGKQCLRNWAKSTSHSNPTSKMSRSGVLEGTNADKNTN